MIGKCEQCGTVAELDVMDFGPYLGRMNCADCWDAECERVWAEIDNPT